MRLFEVGGAVRDALLGEPVHDRDWVAVGATPEELLALGYKPVGRNFPVFLHPQTGEEVALARTERKSAPGYHGFVFHAAPSVTLEEDLRRRDLTINAMARGEDGTLIDPCGGLADLRAGVLRHVSPAFVEDPVRLLRVARFAARWPQFVVAPETLALLRQMVAGGEVDALVPERVWQELSRGLMEQRPSRLWQVLADCHALDKLLPELPATALRLARVDRSAALGLTLAQRYALALQPAADGGDTGVAEGDLVAAISAISAVGQRWRVPADCQEMALLLQREQQRLLSPAPDAATLMAGLDGADAWRRPERFAQCLQAAAVLGEVDHPRWTRALSAAQAVPTAEVAAAAARAGGRGEAIGQAVRQARLDAISSQLA